MKKMNKVIVTGATGFIGRCLTEFLIKKGIEVYGVGRNMEILNSLAKDKHFHPIVLDFKDYNLINQVIKVQDIDVFFHTAHFGVNGKNKNDYRIQLNNAIAAGDAVNAAAQMKCERFLYVGSVDEYEACMKPDDKFIIPSHSRVYGLSKFAADNIGKTIAFSMRMEYVSVLLSLTYGEGNKTGILPNTIIRNSRQKEPIKLIKGNNLFDMIYVEEAVEGIIAVAEKGINMESYYIGHTELKTFKDTVKDICKVIKSESELYFGEYPDPEYNIDYHSINRNKLYDDTGYKCNYDFAESIRNTANWLEYYDKNNM